MYKWLKTQDQIVFEIRDRVARITLNRPEKRNALSPQMQREIAQALLEADDRLDVNCVVIRGEGKDFCAGYDLAAAYDGRGTQQFEGVDSSLYRPGGSAAGIDNDCWGMERNQDFLMKLFDMHKPVIAQVHGNCLAGGTDVALSCDMVIAAHDARIGFPATRANGSPPINWWMYNIGPQRAKRMLLTGDSVNGKDAARIGLVMDSVPASELAGVVDEAARRMSCVDSDLLAAQKRVVNLAMELMHGRTMQRLALEMDARAHLSNGPQRTAFRQNMEKYGLKESLKQRDALFGDGMLKFGDW